MSRRGGRLAGNYVVRMLKGKAGEVSGTAGDPGRTKSNAKKTAGTVNDRPHGSIASRQVRAGYCLAAFFCLTSAEHGV